MSPGEHVKNVYKAIPLPVFVSEKKRPKEGIFQIILCLSVCLLVSLFGNYSQEIGPEGIKLQGLMGFTMGGCQEGW